MSRRGNLWCRKREIASGLQDKPLAMTIPNERPFPQHYCKEESLLLRRSNLWCPKTVQTRMGEGKREIATAPAGPRNDPHSSLRGGAPFAPTWQSLVPKVYWGSQKRDCFGSQNEPRNDRGEGDCHGP